MSDKKELFKSSSVSWLRIRLDQKTLVSSINSKTHLPFPMVSIHCVWCIFFILLFCGRLFDKLSQLISNISSDDYHVERNWTFIIFVTKNVFTFLINSNNIIFCTLEKPSILFLRRNKNRMKLYPWKVHKTSIKNLHLA